MTFFKRINTNTNIRPFINNCSIRYSHHDSQHYYLSQKNRDIRSLLGEEAPQKIIINLLGEQKSVDTASWEIYIFAQEKQLPSANIVHHNKMLKDILYNNYLQFIVNRCYNMSCQNLLYLNNDIINTNIAWKPYNLYVIPDATNRFITCDFIRNCENAKIIIYPLAAPEENKRRDISFLIDN